MTTKERLIQLAEVLGTRNPKRGGDRNWYLFGRRGDIYADTNGYSLAAEFKTSFGLNRAKAALSAFAQLRQDGDTEAIWLMADMPNATQAKTIRHWLKLPKRRVLTDEQRAAASIRLAEARALIAH